MKFLNIFPSRLRVEKSDGGPIHGTLFFTFEQYGLIFSEQQCDVSFAENLDGWSMTLGHLTDVDTPHFAKFTQALNHYVLSVLKFTPDTGFLDASQMVKELYFEDVFFDLSSDDNRLKKVVKPKK